MKKDKLTYKLEEKGPFTQSSVIEKRGHIITFSLEDIMISHQRLAKAQKELTAQQELEDAKMKNIEAHNEFIKDLTDEQMHAVHMYWGAKQIHAQCVDKLKEIGERISEDEKEIEDIKAQIPDFLEEEKGIVEQANEVVEKAVNEKGE